MPDFSHYAITSLINLLKGYGYLAVFFFIAIESIGFPSPGGAVLMAASIYAGATHNLNILLVVFSAILGAITGDNIGFWIGRKKGYPLLQRFGKRIRLDESKLKLGETLFSKYGGRVVFFGRFIAILRIFAAFLAGVNNMIWKRFLLFNFLGGVVWASFYGFGGYLLGDNFKNLVGPIRVFVFSIVILVLILPVVFMKQSAEKFKKH